MSEKVQSVQRIYEAFGRGDVPAALDELADDVQWEAWENNHAQRAGVGHLAPRTDKAGVAEFFALVGGMGVKEFSILDLGESEHQVMAEVVIETESVRDEELHLWTFGPDGKVTRMRHYVDTAKHMAAAGVPAPAA
jgi:ketosteroid isomerase-like protein